MESRYMFLSLATATLGFVVWYTLSPSIRMRKYFQIQFDKNDAYVNRIIRRRLLGFIVYGLVPWLLIFHWDVLGEVRLHELHVSFDWTDRVPLWLLIFSGLIAVASWYSLRDRSTLVAYPDIRVTIWSPVLLILNALAWLLFLVALEFLFRGLVLQSLFLSFDHKWLAIIISAALYGMIQYITNKRVTTYAIPFAIVGCYATLDSQSLLPVIFLHFVGIQVIEMLSIIKHPETVIES